MMRYCFIAVLLAMLPAPVWAEGDTLVFRCHASKVCDGFGVCQPADSDTTFVLSPIKRGPNGEGPHRIAYNGQKYQANNVTGRGPLVWSRDGKDVQTLLFAGENEMIWHRLTLDSPARSTLEFLTCKDAS